MARTPETRVKEEFTFEALDEDGTLPAAFRLVCWSTPQQADGRTHDGWFSTAPGQREVLIENLTRRGLESLIRDGVNWLAFNGAD